jgi:hypothetical protein
MSWLYSQALVEEYSAANSLDGEQSAPSSGNHTQQAYCAPDKTTDFSRLSRYGMTYKPLTESLGKELLTLYLEDFRAKTSAQQEKAQESMESAAECGEKWHASFAKYSPDLSLWKTPQCSLLGDLEEFSETWPQWGLMRNGGCWEQRTLEQTIRGTGFGLSERLPTPQATDHRSKPTSASWKAKGGMNYSLANPEIQKKWPTPVKSDYAGRRPSKGWKGDSDLPSVVWTETGGKQNPEMSPASLNATWVEWLMGWPLGWTDLKPLEMDKSHCVQLPPGGC